MLLSSQNATPHGYRQNKGTEPRSYTNANAAAMDQPKPRLGWSTNWIKWLWIGCCAVPSRPEYPTGSNSSFTHFLISKPNPLFSNTASTDKSTWIIFKRFMITWKTAKQENQFSYKQ